MVACIIAFQYSREKDFKAHELDAQLQLVNAYILNELAKGKSPDKVELKEISPFEDLRISMINDAGIVVFDNTLDSLSGRNHLNREEVEKAMTTGHGFTMRRHSETTGETYFYSARRGKDGGIVRTAVPYSINLSEVLSADYGFLWVMGGITAVLCFLGFFATRRLGLHVSRLNLFAKKAELGERISDTESFPDDELGAISSHIVRLYARLQQANADRDREHRAAINEQQEKERIKKQLTNNINHELKTPVASIHVCAETLHAHEDMPAAKRKDFIERILACTGRLKHLMDDVSLITRIDDGGEAIAKERVDLSGIIAEVVAYSEPAAAASGMDIVNSVDVPLYMQGNHNLLASVFQNLIDNAIAYSGGTKVCIKLSSADENTVKLIVHDNGAGVSDKHLPHLFERFYRVDKGRSRATGGTGLGLSIVKNAVLFHGGTIVAATRPTGGLEFRLVFSR